MVAGLGLTETEVSWLKMHAHRVGGDWSRACSQARQLPPDTYPDHLWVLVEGLARGACSPSEIVGQAGAAPHDHPARLTLEFLAGSDVFDEEGLVEKLIPLAQSRSDNQRDDSPNALDKAFNLLSEGVESGSFTADELTEVANASLTAADELIDRYPRKCRVDSQSSLYMKARLDPSLLEDEELRRLGHTREIARRAYAVDDRSQLNSMSDHGATFYRQLLRLRDGDSENVSELLGDETLSAVVRSLRQGEIEPDVLTDPTTWRTLSALIRPEHTARHPDAAAGWHLEKAMDGLFAWEWRQAADLAREVLRLSKNENIRDEALNVLGFALYEMGEAEAAIAGLERAIEGAYSANLQANIGVIAEQLSPGIALQHVGKLALEAPTTELRLAAARRILTIWTVSRPVWSDDSDEDEDRFAPELVKVLRELVASPIGLPDHRWVARLLATVDADWMSDVSKTRAVPNANTHEHKVYVARAAKNPKVFVSALKQALEDQPNEDWLQQERDELVSSLTALIFKTKGAIGPAVFAFEAIEQGLPMRPLDRVALTAGAVISITQHLWDEEGEPSDRLLELLNAALTVLPSIEHAKQEMAKDLLDGAFDSYARGVANARNKAVSEAVDAVSRLETQLALIPRSRINWVQVAQATQPIREFLSDTISALERAHEAAVSADLKAGLVEFRDEVRQLQTAVERMGR